MRAARCLRGPDIEPGKKFITQTVTFNTKDILTLIMTKQSLKNLTVQPSELYEDKLAQLELIINEANRVRNTDKTMIEGLLGNFYGRTLNVGIEFKRAYGSILSGDYFNLTELPDGNYLFVFADLSGHGLPAYTNLIRLNSSIILAVRESERIYCKTGILDTSDLIRDITIKFTDIMEELNNEEFASVLFTFITNQDDKFHLKFYNHGMFFPMIIRKFRDRAIDVYDLNKSEKGWFPQKGYLMGCALRDILGDKYYLCPCCEFTLYEGDRALFYSDGIVESINPVTGEEFGEGRIRDILIENVHSAPQETIDTLFRSLYGYIENPHNQKDDMTSILIDFPLVR